MSDKKRNYEIEEQIARGGMGEVYRAKKIGAHGFHRRVAIKRLRDSNALDFDARTMLQQEAQLCAMLDHPNIVPVWDFDEDSKKCVRLVMPYVDGVDLEDLISVGMLPVSVSIYVIISILRGLAHAHSLGIIHRDIKPGNILISRAGAVQIVDFGLARDPDGIHLAAQLDAGTSGFMSPEALQSGWQDARSDLFAVGAIFYELLTGTRAFPGSHHLQRMAETLCQTPAPPVEVRPSVPQDLSDITMRLLAPKAKDRFSSAQEVLDALAYPPAQHGRPGRTGQTTGRAGPLAA
jgi:serine/threonine-protein kinase